MSSPQPLFSVIIPLHDKGIYILETLQSLLSQTFQQWEAIVIENRSTDDGPEKVKSLQDPRIQLMMTEAQGPCSARNHGIRFAQGTWILFLDADDLLPANYFHEKIKAIQDQPGRDLYTCPWEERDPNGKTEHHEPFGPCVSQEEMLASSFIYPPFAIHTTIIRRETLTPDRYWPEFLDQGLCEDAVFWFQLLSQTSIAFHHGTKAIYRVRTPECRNQVENLVKTFESYEKIIKSNLQFLHDRKINTNARHAYFLYTFYQRMERESRKQGIESLTQNAQVNLDKIYPKMSPWDRFKVGLKKALKFT